MICRKANIPIRFRDSGNRNFLRKFRSAHESSEPCHDEFSPRFARHRQHSIRAAYFFEGQADGTASYSISLAPYTVDEIPSYLKHTDRSLVSHGPEKRPTNQHFECAIEFLLDSGGNSPRPYEARNRHMAITESESFALPWRRRDMVPEFNKTANHLRGFRRNSLF